MSKYGIGEKVYADGLLDGSIVALQFIISYIDASPDRSVIDIRNYVAAQLAVCLNGGRRES